MRGSNCVAVLCDHPRHRASEIVLTVRLIGAAFAEADRAEGDVDFFANGLGQVSRQPLLNWDLQRGIGFPHGIDSAAEIAAALETENSSTVSNREAGLSELKRSRFRETGR